MRDDTCGNTWCSKCKTPLMLGKGNPTAEIVLLGEAPGNDEDEAGEPFVGRAGNFLRKYILPGTILEERDLFFTNSVRCFPGKNKNGGIRNPLANNIRKCRPNLVEEIRELKPKVIIAMGNVALHACMDLSRPRDDETKKDTQVTGIKRWRGKPVWHSEFDCWVIPTFHPSYLMRKYKFERFEFDQVRDDFDLAARLVKKKPRKHGPDRGLYHLGQSDIAEEYITALLVNNVPEVAVDTETATLDHRVVHDKGDETLLGASFASTTGVYIEINGKMCEVTSVFIPSSVLLKGRVRELFQKLLSNPKITKVWHNVAFDERILRGIGFDLGDIHQYNHICTMLAAKLLDENFSVGLKELTWRFLHFGGYERLLDEYRRENKITSFADFPLRMLSKYAALDTLATILLWQFILKPGLEKENLYRLYRKTVMPMRMIFTSFEMLGLCVDVKRAESLVIKCKQVREKLLGRMYKLAGGEFNVKSYPQLRNIIFQKLKAKSVEKTKTGQDATGKEALQKVLKSPKTPKRAKQFIQAHFDVAYLNKQLSTYIEKLTNVVWDDGRVHTRFNMAGTVTGRPTSSDPNIANVPKDGLIRSLYTASEGNVLLECDMEAAELRVLAAYCKEPVMVDAFATGKDLHKATYRMVFDKPEDYEPTKQERDKGKRLNFGTIYGIGPGELANKFQVTEEEAASFLKLYFRKMRHVKKWLNDNEEFGKKNGYVISFFNRKRRLPEIKSDSFREQGKAVRQANNAVIQSCASDLCYAALVRAYYMMKLAKLKARMVHSVYDSALIELPRKEVPIAKKILTKAFETPIKGLPDFHMSVEFSVDDRWGKNYPSRLAEVLKMVPWDERKAA